MTMTSGLVASGAQWLERELRPTWIERSGFPDGSIALAPGDAASVIEAGVELAITQGQINDAIAFGEFLAGHSFTGDERVTVAGTVLAEFEASPESAMARLLAVRKAIGRIRATTPIERVRRRTEALTQITLAERRAGATSAVMEIVHAHHPTLLVDAERSVVITRDTFDAWGRWRVMIAGMVGLELDGIWDGEQELAELPTRFDGWTDEQVEPMTRAHESLITARAGLRAAGADARLEMIEAMQAEISGPDDIERVARALGYLVKVTDLIDAVMRLQSASHSTHSDGAGVVPPRSSSRRSGR